MGKELKKIAENDKAIFYKNEFCKDYKDGYKIVIAEQKKNKYTEYVLLKNNKPIYASQSIEAIWYKKDMLDVIKKFK
jgi:hypothetical protein